MWNEEAIATKGDSKGFSLVLPFLEEGGNRTSEMVFWCLGI